MEDREVIMNAEEPTTAEAQDGGISQLLPEQAKVKSFPIPRGIGIVSLIRQWQPMGIRVRVGIPFIGNDRTCFFVIRNGPFIPRWDKQVFSLADVGVDCSRYAYNNMRNVHLQVDGKTPIVRYPEKYNNTLTQFDYPPILSSLSQCFRKWCGTMHYRIRVVSSFASQGYIVTMPIKQQMMPIAIYDEYVTTTLLGALDLSYREAMQHAYQSSDVSMFRHVEVSMPFDYPVPWYDQFEWIGNRMPGKVFIPGGTDELPRFDGVIKEVESFGTDNWIGIGLRGDLTSQSSGSITFELEYRAGEDFQFSDPGLVVDDLVQPYQLNYRKDTPEWDRLKSIPNSKFQSNGFNEVKERRIPVGAQSVRDSLYPDLSSMHLNGRH